MTPLRAKMIYQMQLERLAPKTQRLMSPLWRAWRRSPIAPPINWIPIRFAATCTICWSTATAPGVPATKWPVGSDFSIPKTLGWEPLYLNLPPRTGRSQLPQVLSVEELQRLFTSAKNPRNRVLLMTTYAAGLRVSEVVQLRLTDIESERGLIRVEQGKGRKDRYTRLATRLLTDLRAYWKLYRPAPWLFTGLDPHAPLPIGTAQKIYYPAKRAAGITHGHGIHTLRHCFATHLLEAGVDVRTIQMLLGHQALDTPTQSLRITRQHLATVRSPFDLLPCGDPPLPTPE